MRNHLRFSAALLAVVTLLALSAQLGGQDDGLGGPAVALAGNGELGLLNVGAPPPTATVVAGTIPPNPVVQTPAPTFGIPTSTATSTPTRTATPLPPTATRTPTPLPPTPTPTATPTIWRPALNTSYQIQFTGALDTSVAAQLFEFDAFDTPASTVATVRAKGAHAACYLNAGAWEDWRPDAGDFPSWVLGNGYDDWPGERWIDIRQLPTLAPIFHARMELCRTKGFEAVEFDNVDSYTHPTGFPLTAEHQLIFNIFLADLAHQHGLSAGLKNNLEQVPILSWFYDWALNEECFEYGECHLLTPFIQQGKAVFIIEYTTPTSVFCPQAAALNMNAIRKRLNLDAWRQTCP